MSLSSECVCLCGGEHPPVPRHDAPATPLHPPSLPQSKGGGLGIGLTEGEGGCHRQCSSPWCSGILQDCTGEAINTISSTDSGIFPSVLLSLYTVLHDFLLKLQHHNAPALDKSRLDRTIMLCLSWGTKAFDLSLQKKATHHGKSTNSVKPTLMASLLHPLFFFLLFNCWL